MRSIYFMDRDSPSHERKAALRLFIIRLLKKHRQMKIGLEYMNSCSLLTFKQLLLYLLIFRSLASLAMEENEPDKIVYVHVGQDCLSIFKNDLVTQSDYFKTLFSDNFKKPKQDENGNFHIYLCRNFESLSVIWDYLNYREFIPAANKRLMKLVERDALYLQIPKLVEQLQTKQPKKKKKTPKKESGKKIAFFIGLPKDVEKRIDDFLKEKNRILISNSITTYLANSVCASIVYRELPPAKR